MADELELNWEKEDIPNENLLYMRVHRNDMRDGRPIPGAFRNSPKDSLCMSTNWDEYSDAKKTRIQGKQPPENYAVISMIVEKIRNIPNQKVEHTPNIRLRNRAHTDVIGEKKSTEIRLLFTRVYEIAIALEDAVE